MKEQQQIAVGVTAEDYARLEAEAARQGTTVEALVLQLLQTQLRERTQPRAGKGVVRPFRRSP